MLFILGAAFIQKEPQNISLQAYRADSLSSSTACGEKRIPARETWKLCTEDRSTNKIRNQCYLMTWNSFFVFSNWPRLRAYKHCLTTQEKLRIAFCLGLAFFPTSNQRLSSLALVTWQLMQWQQINFLR